MYLFLNFLLLPYKLKLIILNYKFNLIFLLLIFHQFDENSSIISTCPQIIQICEKDEITSCNWHLSELRIKCQQTFEKNNICLQKKREAKCSSALGRFVRFVSAQLVEAMMFCNVSQHSVENDMLNTLLHPTNCLFSSNEHKQQQWSSKMCKAEPYCSHRLNYLISACPLSNISSSHSSTCLLPDNPSSLRKCRFALAKSRGTWLDEPCHCLPNGGGDFKECKKWEMTLWPKNPCIEKITTDFNQLFIGGYLKLEQKRKNKTNNVLIKKTKIKEKELGSIEKGIFVIEDDKEGKSLDKEENISKEKINKKSNESSVENDKLVKHKIIEEAKNITNKNEKENNNNNNELLLSYYLDEKQTNKEDKSIDQVEFIKKRKRPIGRKINANNISFNTELIDVNEFQTPIVSEGRGCRTRNIDGEWIEHYTDTIFRQFTDWSGRCSGWCECIVKGKENGNSDNVSSSHTIRCHSLGCLQDRLCETKHTTIVFGQRLYLENRGACLCHNGQFICDSSELQPELEPGIYISLGYSQAEIDIIREKVPKLILERSGIISHSNSIIKDLVTRLQFALEKILPNGLKCRIVVLEHFKSEQGVLMKIQWFGIDHSANQTQAKWQSGKMEKHCSPYVRELELTFWLEKSERYQLLLSTIKQIRAVDLLDALPLSSSARKKIIFKNKWLTFLLRLLVLVLYRRFW